MLEEGLYGWQCRPTTFVQISVAWKCGTGIHGLQRRNPNDFGDHPTFPILAPYG